jgi:hypothetical protein
MDLRLELQPETPLEKQLLCVPEFVRGLSWGVPRYGHPEGEVYKHVREVLDNIDQLPVDDFARERLRQIAFVHDTFKYLEDKTHPRDWSKHHGAIGRRFLEKFTDDPAVLAITEMHDEAYYSWRHLQLHHQPEAGKTRLQRLFNTIGTENLQLYYLFFKCDTRTGDKIQAPVKWFEKNIKGIEIVNW